MAAKIGMNKAEIDRRASARCENRCDPLSSAQFGAGNSPTRTSRGRAVDLGESEIVEMVVNVALNIFQNYMSHVAHVSIDFPQQGIKRDTKPRRRIKWATLRSMTI